MVLILVQEKPTHPRAGSQTVHGYAGRHHHHLRALHLRVVQFRKRALDITLHRYCRTSRLTPSQLLPSTLADVLPSSSSSRPLQYTLPYSHTSRTGASFSLASTRTSTDPDFSYVTFASSALAGQSLSRNLFGMAFPLFTTQMYAALTYHWANTMFAFVALVMSPVPFVRFPRSPPSLVCSALSIGRAGAVLERPRPARAQQIRCLERPKTGLISSAPRTDTCAHDCHDAHALRSYFTTDARDTLTRTGILPIRIFAHI